MNVKEGRIGQPGSPGIGFLDAVDRHFHAIIGGQRRLAWAETHLARAIFRALAEQLGGEERDGRFEVTIQVEGGGVKEDLTLLKEQVEALKSVVIPGRELIPIVKQLVEECPPPGAADMMSLDQRLTTTQEAILEANAQVARLHAAVADLVQDLARLNTRVSELEAPATSWDAPGVVVPSSGGSGRSKK